MSILLTILKIIGIILLFLLAMAIIFLVLLLFVPFRYRIQGSFSEGKPAGNAELRYLFPLLRVSFSYESDKKTGVIRLLGIKLFDFFSPPKQKKVKENKNGSRKGQKVKNTTFISDLTENKTSDITDRKLDTTNTDAANTDTADADTSDIKEKQSLWQKIQLRICKIKEWAKKLQRTIIGLYHKTLSLRQKWESVKAVLSYYAETLKRNETKSALRLAKNTLKKLWKSVGPRKGRLRVRFGTGDPGSCGEICAFLGMVYPFIGNYVMIEPEMEKAVFDCDVWLCGHVTVFALLKAGWVVLFNPEIKYLKEVMKPSGKEDK